MPTEPKQYRVPMMRRIGRSEATERLYRADHTRDVAFKQAAEELQAFLIEAGELPDDANYYRDVLPDALFSMLESQDGHAAVVGALAFLDWYKGNRPKVYSAALTTFNATKDDDGDDVELTRQTACKYCGLDIENSRATSHEPYPAGEWRDRGNNTHCNDQQHAHAPVPD